MEKTFSTVYGPVFSWRLGWSLGIDPITPPKTCTFDCVYCQLGRTIKKVSKPEDVYHLVDVETVCKDLKRTLNKISLESLDYVTFSGFGEPTLNLEIGRMVDSVRKLVKDKPIAILTNASLLNREDVRKNLEKMDFVVAKLDAANQKLFEIINRPSGNLRLNSIVENLRILRQKTTVRIAIQTMLFKSTKNKNSFTKLSILKNLAKLIKTIKPDEVQLNTPRRPPAESHISPLEPHEMKKIAEKFKMWLDGTKVITPYTPIKPKRSSKKREVTSLELLEVLKRRPCSIEDLTKTFTVSSKTVRLYLENLIKSGKVTVKRFYGKEYYKAK
ncbi:hypothetical protein DRO26_00810 [Candidatus Bathyarchaeota archaeon]|nr:MAG: hypothetical protein DRO26_00810 [Candidatus Bathyarchaeota archaeon]